VVPSGVKIPGIVRTRLAGLADGEPARRDHRGRARPGRSRAIGGSPLSDLAIGCASKWTAPWRRPCRCTSGLESFCGSWRR